MFLLNQDIKNHLAQFLSISDYCALEQTCQTARTSCVNPLKDTFWKNVYQNSYSSQPLQIIGNINPWKDYIRHIEQTLKTQVLFSKKLQICVEQCCEKLGPVRSLMKDVAKRVLTTCLRDLAANKQAHQKTKMAIAKELLDKGADPLQVTLQHLDDYPLRVAVVNGDKDMMTLFLQNIPDTQDNRNKIVTLLS